MINIKPENGQIHRKLLSSCKRVVLIFDENFTYLLLLFLDLGLYVYKSKIDFIKIMSIDNFVILIQFLDSFSLIEKFFLYIKSFILT